MINDKKLTDSYKKIHSNEDYGYTSLGLIDFIEVLALDKKPSTILDYGCGQSKLSDELSIRIGCTNYKYEPSIDELSTIEVSKVDMVVNTDVLEHIPEEILDSVLIKIKSLSTNVYFNIHNGLASKILEDGTNAHCTVHPPEWWEEKLKSHFAYVQQIESPFFKSSSFVTWPISEETMVAYNKLIIDKSDKFKCKSLSYRVRFTLRWYFPSIYALLKRLLRK